MQVHLVPGHCRDVVLIEFAGRSDGQGRTRPLKGVADRAQAAGRTLPANYQLNLVAGLDVAALMADSKQALIASSNEPVPMDEMEVAIAEIAGMEYDASSAGTPGYHEAWGQALACAGLFHQFGLYDLYRQ
ncbi:MAG: hypothetical protein ABS35_32205 [Kaistia sp. SCN 65-12]|nr:MAG: hypothetical protein ABS35_32205 [Kaistia sp. SCN 65-12]